MDLYDYFINKDEWFIPKTPNAALTGIKKGMLPVESFVSLSLFLYSPFGAPGKLKILSDKEELKRINELERILAKKDMDLETELMLLYTLDKLVEHKNPEIALFAAESINSIENRYNKSIYRLKDRVLKEPVEGDLSKLIHKLYQYGYINAGKEDIQDYYYQDALSYFNYFDNDRLTLELYIIKIRILTELNRTEDALLILHGLNSTIIPKWHKILLEIEVEFRARNFEKIYDIVKTVNLDDFPKAYREQVDQWRS